MAGFGVSRVRRYGAASEGSAWSTLIGSTLEVVDE
jgi:hypothetical protein